MEVNHHHYFLINYIRDEVKILFHWLKQKKSIASNEITPATTRKRKKHNKTGYVCTLIVN